MSIKSVKHDIMLYAYVAFMLLGVALFITPAYAQSSPAVDVQEPQGRSILLRVGRNVSPTAVEGLVYALERRGCPTTVTSEGGRYKRVIIESNNYRSLPLLMPLTAGAAAIRICEEGPDNE